MRRLPAGLRVWVPGGEDSRRGTANHGVMEAGSESEPPLVSRARAAGLDVTEEVAALLGKRTVSTTEAARILGVRRQTVVEACQERRIRSRRRAIGSGQFRYRIRPADLLAYRETKQPDPPWLGREGEET